jgi:ABC-type Na+ efflux pump permease subunit
MKKDISKFDQNANLKKRVLIIGGAAFSLLVVIPVCMLLIQDGYHNFQVKKAENKIVALKAEYKDERAKLKKKLAEAKEDTKVEIKNARAEAAAVASAEKPDKSVVVDSEEQPSEVKSETSSTTEQASSSTTEPAPVEIAQSSTRGRKVVVDETNGQRAIQESIDASNAKKKAEQESIDASNAKKQAEQASKAKPAEKPKTSEEIAKESLSKEVSKAKAEGYDVYVDGVKQ